MTSSVDIGTSDYAFRALLDNTPGLTGAFNTSIHPNDQMLSYSAASRGSEALARSEYFISGSQLLSIIEQLVCWKFGSLGSLAAFLDFASGYGRLTRFLVQKLPADRTYVSDIQADAVAFQQAEFGVQGFVSTVDPADLPCDRTFDCIFVASLFSHLPDATFTSWLKKLYSLLNPGGMLVFSAHGESRMLPGNSMPHSGIWFDQTSEIASTDAKEYGVSIVTEAFVRNAILEATGQATYHRIEHGLLYQQDLYIVVNEAQPDFSGLRFAYVPHGGIDFGLWTGPGELRLRGWAADITGGGTPVEVQIFVDGQIQQECVPSNYRPDLLAYFKDDRFAYAGWECSCRLPDDDPDRLLMVKSISAGGIVSPLHIGTVGSLLPVGKVDLCLWTKPDELYLKGWVAGIGTDGSSVEVHAFVNEQLRQKCLPFIHRPDLRDHFKDDRFLHAGWACSFHLPEDDPSQVLTIKAVSSSGAESTLYLGTIESLLPLTSLDTFATPSEFDERRRQLKVELDRRLEYIRHLEAEVARKDAALQHLGARTRRFPWQRRSPRW
ncbi:MAG: class I SAM-dependent methyltransferase [Chloroflexota bacterium]